LGDLKVTHTKGDFEILYLHLFFLHIRVAQRAPL